MTSDLFTFRKTLLENSQALETRSRSGRASSGSGNRGQRNERLMSPTMEKPLVISSTKELSIQRTGSEQLSPQGDMRDRAKLNRLVIGYPAQ